MTTQTTIMNSEIKKLWITALRSGEYKQTIGVLKDELDEDGTSFCCLGVLCDIHSKQSNDCEWGEMDDYEGESSALPDMVQKWSGVITHSGFYYDEAGLQQNLAHKNDAGMSFIEIADIIEKHF